jgi:iron complex transport system substrate-binding protein
MSFKYSFLFSIFIIIQSCNEKEIKQLKNNNSDIKHAKSLAISSFDGYSIVTISNPWPNASKSFTYVLKEKSINLPDSLKKYQQIQIPLKQIVVTSTTSIPFLEMLNAENKLVGFPNTDYISSEKTRKRIESGKVVNLGSNEQINIEKIIALNPELIISFGIDNNNTALNNLEKNGLKTLILADWMEQSPLGRAEWIKLFGHLLGKKKESYKLFSKIEKDYNDAKLLAKKANRKPSVLNGGMLEDQWFVTRGDSWMSQFINDANGTYIWKDLKGTGSQAFGFEEVFLKGKRADFWFTDDYKSLENMNSFNTHYKEFEAYKNKKVYSLVSKKGKTGGVLFYEQATARPDLVLKDMIAILHPSLLKNYTFTFAEKIN